MNKENAFQLSFVDDGATRHLFAMHQNGKVIIDWYIALRNAKLQTLSVAFPAAKKEDVSMQWLVDIFSFFSFSATSLFDK